MILAGNHTSRVRRKSRLRAALMHLAISFLVALLVAVIMFAFWYPYPYREISGGWDLFIGWTAVRRDRPHGRRRLCAERCDDKEQTRGDVAKRDHTHARVWAREAAPRAPECARRAARRRHV